MTDRYINQAPSSADQFFNQTADWFYRSLGHYQLSMMIFNLFLIIIVLLFGWLLERFLIYRKKINLRHKIAVVFLFIGWLIFLPNTLYLVTTIRHLLHYCPVNSPFDVCLEGAWMIIVYFAYALIGLLSFIFSLGRMADVFRFVWGPKAGYLLEIIVLPLTSLGVLLGLINRFNSWEIFLMPDLLLKIISQYFTDGWHLFNFIVYTVVTFVIYYLARLNIGNFYGQSKNWKGH